MTAPVRKLLRRAFGVWPVMEWRNRLTMGRRGAAFTRFEDAEVARLATELGAPPTAAIACIIPTYKRPQGVVASVNSILAQERQDFVVVVVDDGAGLPPDLPKDPRVFAVSLSRNSAVLGLVRNVGIRLSRSDYVAFLDDDNTWTPQHLSLAVQAIDDGADLVYTAVRRRRQDGTELDVLSKSFDRRRFADETSWVDANSIVLRRSALLPFSRLPRTKMTFPKEDWEFVWRVSRRARVAHVTTPTVEYLVNMESFYTTWTPPGGEAV
ncbi:glycosyltransferase [Phenylobacterium sp.]|uniref:glycosyltransferase family 2 protein n=1 Tax=Phenylobacterium sp. TaxID=1871053 RepID=UPI0025D627DA|nr:glycosyltransferase [Phenylobacterium sp.]